MRTCSLVLLFDNSDSGDSFAGMTQDSGPFRTHHGISPTSVNVQRKLHTGMLIGT